MALASVEQVERLGRSAEGEAAGGRVGEQGLEAHAHVLDRLADTGSDRERQVRAPLRGQWGVTHDDAGRTFRNTNESALHVDLVADEYFARHPQLLRTRGSYERLAMPDNDLNVVWPMRPTPGVNRGYQAGIRRADGRVDAESTGCVPKGGCRLSALSSSPAALHPHR